MAPGWDAEVPGLVPGRTNLERSFKISTENSLVCEQVIGVVVHSFSIVTLLSTGLLERKGLCHSSSRRPYAGG